MTELIQYLKYLEEKIDKHLKWKKEEYDKGYHDGSNDKGYRPTSRPYIEGFESGEFTKKYRKHLL